MADSQPRKQLGELLKEKGLITEDHIKYALQEQKITRERLGELFERLGFVTEHDVATTLSDQSGVPHIDVDAIIPDEAVLKLFNKNLCLNNVFLPLRRADRTLEVATADISDDSLTQRISRQTGLVPKLFIAEKKKIINAVNKFYYFLENPVERLIVNEVNVLAQDKEEKEDR